MKTTTLEKNAKEIRNLENAVINSCIKAGTYIKENAFNITGLEWKSLDDPVTYLDKNAEMMIHKGISKYGIEANFFGEEYGILDNKSNISIYIDPIDGTKSFIRGEHLSSVSIAAEYNGEIVVGAVYDFMRGIMYYANSKGAFLSHNYSVQEKRLPAIDVQFSKPTVAFSEWDNKKYRENMIEKCGIGKCIDDISARNTIGSIALCMAHLAAGCYDGLIMTPYKKNGITDTCDIAAGYYIMKQAGISITDHDFNEYDYKNPGNGVIALNKRLIGTN